MFQPVVLYHTSDGVKTDFGWSYRRVETQEEYNRLLSNGWFKTVTELINSKPDWETSALIENEEPEEPEQMQEPKVEGLKRGRPRKKA